MISDSWSDAEKYREERHSSSGSIQQSSHICENGIEANEAAIAFNKLLLGDLSLQDTPFCHLLCRLCLQILKFSLPQLDLIHETVWATGKCFYSLLYVA